MPKTSKWQAQHIGCQAAVDSVRAELTARVERLEARLQIATGALEYIAERNYTGGATVAREALAKLVAS